MAGEIEISHTAYYPSGSRPSEASAVRIRWGQELNEVNLVLQPRETYTVSGRVGDARTGGACGSCTIRVGRLDEPDLPLRHFGVGPGGGYRIRGLVPGQYRVAVEAAATPQQHLVSARTVTIRDSDVRNFHLVAGVERSVRGRVLLESPPETLDPAGLEMEMQFWEGNLRAGRSRVAADLSFEAAGFAAVLHQVEFVNPPPAAYFKALRIAGRDMPSPEIELPEQGVLDQVEVVVAFDGATVSGMAHPPDSAGQGHRVTAAAVVLFPQEGQSRFLVQRLGFTGSSGYFRLTGIAPGRYTVVACPVTLSDVVQDPDIRRQLEPYGRSVDLEAGKTVTQDLVLAPEIE